LAVRLPLLLLFVILGLVYSNEHKAHNQSMHEFKTWDPFLVDGKCPKFVLASTGQGGLGDQLEHYVFGLYIAKLFHATIVIDGFNKGMVMDGSTEHAGSGAYRSIASGLLNIDFNLTKEMVDTTYKPKHMHLTYDQVLAQHNKGSPQPCNTLVQADIYSCGGWCHLTRPLHSVRATIWTLRNNTARPTCKKWRVEKFGKSDVKRIIWHIRSGDICLRCEDTNYFKSVDSLLKTALAGYNYSIIFESQKAVPTIQALFPQYQFNVNTPLYDFVCNFLSADIVITSGSSIVPMLMAAGASPWHPIIFEERIKDLTNVKNRVTFHYFPQEHAILLNHGVPQLPIVNVVTAVNTIFTQDRLNKELVASWQGHKSEL
jgi:hypothetical protein